MLIRLLPGEWHAREEWQRVMRVFDPAWQRVNDEFKGWTDISLAEVRELYLSFRVSHAGELEPCIFMELFPECRVPERWQGAERFQIMSVSREQTTWSMGPFVSILQSSPVQLILGSRDAVHDFLQDRPQHPLLRREVERLRANSSEASHLTVFFIPTFVVQHGRELVSSAWQPLLNWLDETLGDGVRAASLSVWIDDVEAFAELRLIPTWEAREELCSRLPTALEALARTWPGSHSPGDEPSLPWRPLRERFESMRRYAFQQVRWSQERDQLVVNVSLPAEAIHNLLLGTELTFREALRAQR